MPTGFLGTSEDDRPAQALRSRPGFGRTGRTLGRASAPREAWPDIALEALPHRGMAWRRPPRRLLSRASGRSAGMPHASSAVPASGCGRQRPLRSGVRVRRDGHRRGGPPHRSDRECRRLCLCRPDGADLLLVTSTGSGLPRLKAVATPATPGGSRHASSWKAQRTHDQRVMHGRGEAQGLMTLAWHRIVDRATRRDVSLSVAATVLPVEQVALPMPARPLLLVTAGSAERRPGVPPARDAPP